MTTTSCRCGRPTRDAAYVCERCGDKLARALGDVAWLEAELATSIANQRGIDYRGLGSSTPAEKPLPIRWGAVEARDELKALLVSWARLCEEESVRHSSPHAGLPADTLTSISRWLLWRVDGLGLHPAGGDAVEEVTTAVRTCRRIIDSIPERWYAGPCNAEVDGVECGTDLYARAEHGNVSCSTCGADYDVPARRAWLLEAAEDRLADAATLARSVSWLGATPLNPAAVRQWASRGRIIAKAHTSEGRPLYRIGDAIDLLAATAMRTRRHAG